jgi:hypothetical protein
MKINTLYEHKSQPLAKKSVYYKRLLNSFFLSFIFILFSLLLGVLGYHSIAGLGWIDSLLNASMILTGMGPVNPMSDNASKLFASIYSIYSGVAFLSSIAVFLSPALHRLMHRLHMEKEKGD